MRWPPPSLLAPCHAAMPSPCSTALPLPHATVRCCSRWVLPRRLLCVVCAAVLSAAARLAKAFVFARLNAAARPHSMFACAAVALGAVCAARPGTLHRWAAVPATRLEASCMTSCDRAHWSLASRAAPNAVPFALMGQHSHSAVLPCPPCLQRCTACRARGRASRRRRWAPPS